VSDDPYNYEVGRQVGNPKQLLPPGYSLHRTEDHFIIVFPDGAESGIDWNRWRLYREAWRHFRRTEQEAGERE